MRPRPRARRIAAALVLVAGAAAAIFLALTPARPSGRALPAHVPDPVNGEVIYHAGVCAGCHKPQGATGVSEPPTGEAPFATPIGTLYPGNLTPDPETGIGDWTPEQFVDAMTEGVSPDGRHYFPAFPYTSYRNMRVEDLLDLFAYLRSLDPVRAPGREAEVAMAGLARRSLGLWKRLAFDEPGFRHDPSNSDAWNRGAYLVHAPGHCGQCHTPRNVLMIRDDDRALEGGPHPGGEDEGDVPGLRNLVGRERYTDVSDLTLALQFGETFGYDKMSSGGMGDVQMSLALLPEEDLRAIAEYLLSLE